MADDDIELRYDYLIGSVQSGSPWIETVMRWEVSTAKQLTVDFYADRAEIWKYDGSAWTRLAQNLDVDSATGTKFDVRVELDGANMKVWRATGGGLETQIFSLTTVPTYDGGRIRFLLNKNMVASLDNIMLLADDRTSTTSFTVATNNELSTSTDYNGSNTFAYDAWGRMTSKTRTGVSATYDYGYGMKLTKVTSTYPDEGTVTYQYGGDGKRRSRSVSGGDFTWYNWDIGYNVIEEEAQGAGLGNGALAKTYSAGPIGLVLAEAPGASPGSGSYAYYLSYNIDSSRALYDQSKIRTATFEYSPYGSDYTGGGNGSITPRFAGMARDPLTHNYHTTSGMFDPAISRSLLIDLMRPPSPEKPPDRCGFTCYFEGERGGYWECTYRWGGIYDHGVCCIPIKRDCEYKCWEAYKKS